jgi:5-methyltetrahydrofolate--homocysteine methyltransferase
LKTDLARVSQMVRDGDEHEVVKLVKEALHNGTTGIDILEKGLIPGIQELGRLFKDGQAYLPEILISVRAMNQGLEVIQPHLTKSDISHKGTVVLGTVEGDIHNIGKDLVGMMLKSNGFDVIDVGVDVPAETFVNAVRENHADIIAMSGLLTTTITYFPVVISALQEAGLRKKVKVLVGGAAVSQEYADEIKAEGFAIDCVSAVDEASRLMKL